MKTEKEVVLAYVDAFNRGDIDGVCELFASDAMIWGVLGWGSPAEARPIWIELMEALQIQLTVDAIIAHEGTVVARYTERGQSVRPFRGLGPTGQSYELLAMEWFEVANGLIGRRWGTRDSGSLNRQLGFHA
jgi:steroid delta-isomerase-like uncharacterized protein